MAPKRPTIVAHRGLHVRFPENSAAAFHAALGVVDWFECDVHQTADGWPVVLHDDTLNRTTDGNGSIATLTVDQVRAARLADGSPIPTLNDLHAGPLDAAGVMVEVKPNDAAGLVELCVAFASTRAGPTVIQSFYPSNLVYALGYNPACDVALLVDAERHLHNPWLRVHADHRLLDVGRVGALRRRGVRVGAWTVNDDADLRRVIGLGVDTVITDEPLRAMQLVDELCGP